MLGTGGHATVFQHGTIAIKALMDEKLWTRECEALQQLSLFQSPHVQRLLHRGAALVNQWPCFVIMTEPVGTPLPIAMIAFTSDFAARLAFVNQVLRHVLIALASVHGRGMIHMDVRPENVIVADGDAVLIDWNCGLRAGNDAHGRGTAVYASLEVWHCETRAHHKHDLYSAALVYASLLFGNVTPIGVQPPWTGLIAGHKLQRKAELPVKDVRFQSLQQRHPQEGALRPWLTAFEGFLTALRDDGFHLEGNAYAVSFPWLELPVTSDASAATAGSVGDNAMMIEAMRSLSLQSVPESTGAVVATTHRYMLRSSAKAE